MNRKQLDAYALAAAIRRAACQPRGDSEIDQLPAIGAVVSTDEVPLMRDGRTYRANVALFPTTGASTLFVNVKDYGAKGNGTTDDTSAVTAAIAAAASLGGAIVYFPPGTYLRSDTWTVTASGISFLGSGPSASKILSKATGVVSPTVLSFTSGVSYLSVEGLGFIGNATPPSGPPPNAPPVILAHACTMIGVYNCYFASSTGIGIYFQSCTGCEVASCLFAGIGYNGSGASTALQTPAVLMDFFSVACRVHHNSFQATQYFAVQHLGTNCETSFNYINAVGACGIRLGNGSSTRITNGRVIGNHITASFKFSAGDGSGGGTGIYVNNADNIVMTGNTVDTCAGDGISHAGCNNCVTNDNIVYNCCQSAGDCGIQFNPQSGNPGGNVGMVYSGNNSYDNQNVPTQQNGMRALGPGSGGAKGTVIVGNSFQGFTGTVGGQQQHGIAASDAILDDDSNAVRSNAGAWLDYQHLGLTTTVNPGVTASAVGTPNGSVLGTATIEASSLGLQRGVRFIAWGNTTRTGAGNFRFFLSWANSLGNWFDSGSLANVAGQIAWKLDAWLFNAGLNNTQRLQWNFYYNGAVVVQGVATSANIDSSSSQTITLQGTADANTTINCQVMTVARL